MKLIIWRTTFCTLGKKVQIKLSFYKNCSRTSCCIFYVVIVRKLKEISGTWLFLLHEFYVLSCELTITNELEGYSNSNREISCIVATYSTNIGEAFVTNQLFLSWVKYDITDAKDIFLILYSSNIISNQYSNIVEWFLCVSIN